METRQFEKSIEVLNHGFITMVMSPENGDLMVVNAARVSFGKHHSKLQRGDKALLNYLVKNKHDSPFRHVQITFRIKAPEFVMRQWYKHIVGISYTPEREIDHAWNEISGRYVEYPDEFYFPEIFRKQSSDNKQATRNEEIDQPLKASEIYEKAVTHSYVSYKELLELGVGREIARTILPLNFYTEVYWTASLQAILNFINLRDHDGSQHEIRLYAKSLAELVKTVAPITMELWSLHRT